MTTTSTPTIPRPTADEPMRQRNVRCNDTLWDQATELAAREGLDMSKVVRHYLRHYIATDPTVAERPVKDRSHNG